MKILRKVLIFILIAVLLFLAAAFVALLGAPHFQSDDLIGILLMGTLGIVLLTLIVRWKPED